MRTSNTQDRCTTCLVRNGLKYIVICALLLAPAFSVTGQHADSDRSDTVAINHLLERAQMLLVRYPDSSLQILKDAYQRSEAIGFSKGMAQSLVWQQSYHFFRNEFAAAERVLRDGLDIANRADLKEGRALIHGHMSRIMRVSNRMDSAFYHLVEADKIVRDFQNPSIKAKHLFEWAAYHYAIGDDADAEQPILDAIELLEPLGNTSDYRYAVYLAVDHYGIRGNAAARAGWLNKYLELKTGESGVLSKYDFYHQNILEAGYAGDPEERRRKIESDLILHQKYGNDYGAFYNALYLAEAYKEAGDIKRAEHFYLQAVHQDYTQRRTAFLMHAQREAANFYREIGRHERALDLFLDYTMLKDSVENVEIQKNTRELKMQFQTAQKEARLARQEIELQEQESQKAELRYALIGVGLALLLFLGFFMYRIRHQKVLEEKNVVIQKALEEKEVLLKEIHHRVKNNLQVISGLLKWQSAHIEDARALHAMNEGQNRVQSMAIIHQKLYQSDNLKGIDMDDYIKRLSQSLFHSYNIKSERVILRTDIAPVNLDIDTVIPLGLILNELISNSLKHAFPDDHQGEISVELREDHTNDALLLSVGDNGVGMREKSDVRSDSFGWELIDTLSQKLKADVDIASDGGTRIQLRIKNYKVA